MAAPLLLLLCCVLLAGVQGESVQSGSHPGVGRAGQGGDLVGGWAEPAGDTDGQPAMPSGPSQAKSAGWQTNPDPGGMTSDPRVTP